MLRKIAILAAAAALATAVPDRAEAQGPVVTGGLVNVTLVDLVDIGDVQVVVQNIAVGVAVNIAAQICGTQLNVPIGVLTQQVIRTGQATACTITDQDGHLTQVQIGSVTR